MKGCVKADGCACVRDGPGCLCAWKCLSGSVSRRTAELVCGAGLVCVTVCGCKTTSKSVSVSTCRPMFMWGLCPCMFLRSHVCLCPGVQL